MRGEMGIKRAEVPELPRNRCGCPTEYRSKILDARIIGLSLLKRDSTIQLKRDDQLVIDLPNATKLNSTALNHSVPIEDIGVVVLDNQQITTRAIFAVSWVWLLQIS